MFHRSILSRALQYQIHLVIFLLALLESTYANSSVTIHPENPNQIIIVAVRPEKNTYLVFVRGRIGILSPATTAATDFGSVLEEIDPQEAVLKLKSRGFAFGNLHEIDGSSFGEDFVDQLLARNFTGEYGVPKDLKTIGVETLLEKASGEARRVDLFQIGRLPHAVRESRSGAVRISGVVAGVAFAFVEGFFLAFLDQSLVPGLLPRTKGSFFSGFGSFVLGAIGFALTYSLVDRILETELVRVSIRDSFAYLATQAVVSGTVGVAVGLSCAHLLALAGL